VGVIVVAGEPVGDVSVTRGEDVAVTRGVDGLEVTEGVNIACNVNAAAVCTSPGGAICSKGMLQARIDKNHRRKTKSILVDFIVTPSGAIVMIIS